MPNCRTEQKCCSYQHVSDCQPLYRHEHFTVSRNCTLSVLWTTFTLPPTPHPTLLLHMSFCFGPSAWPATSPDLTPLHYLPCGTRRTRSVGKSAAARYGVRWWRQGIRWSCEEDDRGKIVHVEWRRALWTETDWTDGFVLCCDRLASFCCGIVWHTWCTYRRARLSCFVLLSVCLSVCLYSTYCTIFGRNHACALIRS